jgi:hypothetical protein
MSDLYKLVNLYDKKDNSWVGQFMDTDTAKAWIKKTKRPQEDFEISKRRPRPDREPS